ncbi:MAG: fumarylacetoacetate hydrolase family protein [Actinobacteria bacterium]|nr:fumarylacetoacetate hydrolase family protein [Actinomycetota bacterium]
MKIARIQIDDQSKLGIVDGDDLALLDLALGPKQGVEVLYGLGTGVDALLSGPAAKLIAEAESQGPRVPLSEARLTSPVPRPEKIFAVGLNYVDHIKESGLEPPDTPLVFAKYANTVSGPYDDIQRPVVSRQLDYEGELGVVIGRRCRHVAKERAHEVVAGYLVLNDVTIRDWQEATSQWCIGKSFDTHCPMGPWLTTAESADAGEMEIRTWVNGDLRQSSNTRNLLFGVDALIAYVSQACTLQPGDVIATGTPGGVGEAMDPPAFLVDGDEVRVEVGDLGALVNPVVDEVSAKKIVSL